MIKSLLIHTHNAVDYWVCDLKEHDQTLHLSDDQIWIDYVGRYSLSHCKEMFTALHELIQIVGVAETDQLSILDGMAGVGGDTSCFLEFFTNGHVVANEINRARYRMLSHNIDLLIGQMKRTSARITLTNADILSYLKDGSEGLRQFDIIYLDPPWGGLLYKVKPHRITVSGIDLTEISQRVIAQFPHLRCLVVKIPTSMDPRQLKDIMALRHAQTHIIPVKSSSHHFYDLLIITPIASLV